MRLIRININHETYYMPTEEFVRMAYSHLPPFVTEPNSLEARERMHERQMLKTAAQMFGPKLVKAMTGASIALPKDQDALAWLMQWMLGIVASGLEQQECYIGAEEEIDNPGTFRIRTFSTEAASTSATSES